NLRRFPLVLFWPPDFDLILKRSLTRSIFRVLTRNQLQNPDLLLKIELEFILAVAGESLTQHNDRRNIPTIHPLDSPVQNLFRRVKRHIGSLLNIAFPINQRTSSANSNDLRNNIL